MNRPYPLIGLTGPALSGKDEVAKVLWLRFRYKVLSFSAALNDCLLALDPIVGVAADGGPLRYRGVIERLGYTAAKRDPEVRRLLQVFGTEVGRDRINENLWVDIVERQVDADGGPCVVTNVRYQNECDMVRRRGGIIVRVDRPGVQRLNQHSSEDMTFEVDDVLPNDGTLQDLERTVVDWFQAYPPTPQAA